MKHGFSVSVSSVSLQLPRNPDDVTNHNRAAISEEHRYTKEHLPGETLAILQLLATQSAHTLRRTTR